MIFFKTNKIQNGKHLFKTKNNRQYSSRFKELELLEMKNTVTEINNIEAKKLFDFQFPYFTVVLRYTKLWYIKICLTLEKKKENKKKYFPSLKVTVRLIFSPKQEKNHYQHCLFMRKYISLTLEISKKNCDT